MTGIDDSLVTVSIVTGRYSEHLSNCLASLPSAAQQVPLKVYVIDNLASFDVAAVIQRFYPGAQIIKNKEIKGFAANHNQVLRICDTPFALVLNDDIILGENCIDFLIEFLNNYPLCGLVGTAVYPYSWNNTPILAGYRPSRFPHIIRCCITDILKEVVLLKFFSFFFTRGKFQITSSKEFTQPLSLAQVSGACCLMRRKVLDEIGLFDERFIMYWEDLDFGLRAIKHGWECYQSPKAKIIHFESASVSRKTFQWVSQSMRYFVTKHYRGLVKVSSLLIIMIWRVVKYLKYGY